MQVVTATPGIVPEEGVEVVPHYRLQRPWQEDTCPTCLARGETRTVVCERLTTADHTRMARERRGSLFLRLVDLA